MLASLASPARNTARTDCRGKEEEEEAGDSSAVSEPGGSASKGLF